MTLSKMVEVWSQIFTTILFPYRALCCNIQHSVVISSWTKQKATNTLILKEVQLILIESLFNHNIELDHCILWPQIVCHQPIPFPGIVDDTPLLCKTSSLAGSLSRSLYAVTFGAFPLIPVQLFPAQLNSNICQICTECLYHCPGDWERLDHDETRKGPKGIRRRIDWGRTEPSRSQRGWSYLCKHLDKWGWEEFPENIPPQYWWRHGFSGRQAPPPKSTQPRTVQIGFQEQANQNRGQGLPSSINAFSRTVFEGTGNRNEGFLVEISDDRELSFHI